MKQDDQHDYYLDNLMTQIIDLLVDDKPEDAANGMLELAQYFAKAGMPKQSFANLRSHLIDEAESKTGYRPFIQEKLNLAEKALLEARGGSSIIIH